MTMTTNLSSFGSNIGAGGPAQSGRGFDVNEPSAYLNTAYDALKFNPQATQQTLQAVQQGKPDLKGLAAMAAARSQQMAQQTQTQAQQHGIPPTVLQQLIQSSGIMGQLPNQMAMAHMPDEAQGLGSIPASPESLPEGMAMGGLVSLAGGGMASLDDPEVDNDVFWDNDGDVSYNAGPDFSLDTLGRLAEKSGMFSYDPDFKEKLAKTKQQREDEARQKELDYYSTTTPSPSKARELGLAPAEESSLPAQADLPPPSQLQEAIGSLFAPPKETPHGDREPPAAQLTERIDDNGHKVNPKSEMPPEGIKTDPAFKNANSGHSSTVPLNGGTTNPNNDIDSEIRSAKDPEMVKALLDKAWRREVAENGPQSEKALHYAMQIKALGGAVPEVPEGGMGESRTTQKISSPQGQGIASLQAGESMGVPEKRPRDYDSELAALEHMMGGTYQLPPEIMAELAKNKENAREDKWLAALTGLGAGTLSSTSPFLPQAIGQGLMTGLGAYQQGAREEDRLGQQQLAAQMAQARAPYDTHQAAFKAWMEGEKNRAGNLAKMQEKYGQWGHESNLERMRQTGRLQRDQAKAAMTGSGSGEINPRDRAQIAKAVQDMLDSKIAVEEKETGRPITPQRRRELAEQAWAEAQSGQMVGMGSGFSSGTGAPVGFITRSGFRPNGQ